MYLLCNLTPLLVVVATIGVAFGAPDCYGAQSYYQNQLPMYEHMHKWMNLTMDCNAVYSAVDAVQRHSKGEKDTVMEEYWCKYSRYTYLFFIEMLCFVFYCNSSALIN
ncbi:unnamed protein product [Nippostrongylus brasiliensis]|uniref:Lipocalin n=1 Tax=Nippostrongylus brasiliensis TaxID=27835 RepID=A0A0N4YDQ9_NIPBR|nr:unnamed protein product [Nippostrongylus brasiliensis]